MERALGMPSASPLPSSGDVPLSLAVVIVTYNSAEVLPGLLDTLEAGLAGAGPCQVTVVDNNSTDHSAEVAETHAAGVRVLRSHDNGGFAAGINLAAAQSPAEAHLLILNPDIRLDPGAIAALVARASDARVGIAVPRIRNEDGTTAMSLRREPSLFMAWMEALLGPTLAARIGLGEMIADPRAYATPHGVDWATGAILLVTATARRLVGRWDESFFLYSEEVEFQRRVRDAGLQVAFEPGAEVTHIGGDYKSNPGLSALMASNKIRYFARYHGTAATSLFRASLLVFAVLRAWRSVPHRAMLGVALSPLRPPKTYVPG